MSGSTEILLLLLSLGAALGYGLIWLRQAPSLLRSIFKTVPIAALAVLAYVANAPWLLVAALGLSALGDLALSRDGETAFMAGLGAFLLAHIAYVPLLAGVAVEFEIWRGALAVMALVYTALVMRWLWPHLGPLRAPVGVYVLAIATMGVAAIFAPLALWPILLGAALFIASDTVLAAETFVFTEQPRRWTAPVVWVTYYAGQALIASAWICGYFSAAG